MKDIAIIGAGGLGKEMLTLIYQINAKKPVWNVVGFYDDQIRSPVAGLPVLGSLESLYSVPDKVAVVIAVGDPLVKQKMASGLVNPNLYFPSLVHPDTTIGLNIKLGEGSVITAGCRLTVDITLGKHVLLNLNSTIGHDV
ncbi:MAG TPA: acetyltransferase, partial [Cyclobacteriaceae bacterium]|nr:acetyltransferase [Cyclobacteriaceae bacterium]